MIKDYYDILSLKHDASVDEIAQQYKRLVLRWHPRFAKEDQKTAHFNFSQISEAYEVLSDPLKRAFYDRYGYLKLKEGLFS
jgi:DnaJ-class molecular chaperone